MSLLEVTPKKLTKKQKKSLAFRERKQGISKDEHKEDNPGSPVMEDQDVVGGTEVQTMDWRAGAEDEQKGEQSEGEEQSDMDAQPEPATMVAGRQKKRKRESVRNDVEVEGERPKRKKSKGTVGEAGPTGSEKVKAAKQRFILFVGNLKYTTSTETIKEHFAICDPPPSIRLLTPRSGSSNKSVAKSKGCAFLEFSHRNALQQALKLHQSELEGRKINVELTAGGGGKSEARITKLRGRNRGLHDQRKKRVEKAAPTENIEEMQPPEQPQRYSATSGVGQAITTERTWTVGDVEDGKTRRGGQKKHSKKRSKKDSREWGTGVNAIPVG